MAASDALHPARDAGTLAQCLDPRSPARTVGPAIASMLIYLLMALVLYLRPAGLFPARGR